MFLTLDKWIRYSNFNFLIVSFIIKYILKIFCTKNTNLFEFNLNDIIILFDNFNK